MRGKTQAFFCGCWVGLVFLLLVGGLSLAAERDKVSFNSDWLFYGRDLGWFTAQGKGFYTEAGLDVKIVRGYGSGDTVKKVATGTNDYGNADMGVLVKARAQGMKLKAIGIIHDKSLHVIFTTKDKGIQKPKDLEGHTIGVPQGSAPHQMFSALASVNGVDLSKVKWVFMSPPATIPSVISGKVDATVTFNTVKHIFSAKARAAGKEPVSILYSDHGVDLYSSAFITTEQRIREKRDQVRRFIGATYKGIAYAVEHPEEATDIFMKYNPTTTRKAVLATWHIVMDHLLTPTALKMGIGYQTREKTEYTRDIMMKYGGVSVRVPVEDVYTNEFLPKLFPKRPKR
ncbi:MAG: ABC transporter substrate-binding protein [Nitrospinota bacterium]